VILLSDGGIGNSSEPWRIPDPAALPKPEVRFRTDPVDFHPYQRDENLARPWVRPGTPGLEHRLGGLEKDCLSGEISGDPANHQRMVELRAAKVAGVASEIPPLLPAGAAFGELLVVGWGSTYGAIKQAVEQANATGAAVGHLHLRYLNPLPTDLGDVLRRYQRVLVPELNLGQLAHLIRDRCLVDVVQLDKVQGRPFGVAEVYHRIKELMG
jgi:2-oxoglutarate/2-oxoacid ferredoxin oxidoreductase subunit alpha